jgi:hypothetical protein
MAAHNGAKSRCEAGVNYTQTPANLFLYFSVLR